VLRIEDHDPFIGQHQEGRIIVIVRLKTRANQHLCSAVLEMIDLCGFDGTMYINIADIGAIDGSLFILVVQSPRIGKPTPGTLFGKGVVVMHYRAAEKRFLFHNRKMRGRSKR